MTEAGASGSGPEGTRPPRVLPLVVLLVLPLLAMLAFELFWPWVLLDEPKASLIVLAIAMLAAFNYLVVRIWQGRQFGKKRALAMILFMSTAMGVVEGPYLLRQALTIIPFLGEARSSVIEPFRMVGAGSRGSRLYVEEQRPHTASRRVAIMVTEEVRETYRERREQRYRTCLQVSVQESADGYRRAFSSSIVGSRLSTERLIIPCRL